MLFINRSKKSFPMGPTRVSYLWEKRNGISIVLSGYIFFFTSPQFHVQPLNVILFVDTKKKLEKFCYWNKNYVTNYLQVASIISNMKWIVTKFQITYVHIKSVLNNSFRSTTYNPCQFSILQQFITNTSSFPFPFVPLQRRGCLVAPLFLWIVLVPCAGD
jgi:hypothetical protein